MNTFREALPAMRVNWLLGRPAADRVPQQLLSLLRDATPEDQERGLVALAGQYSEIAVRPVLPDNIDELCPIPVLSKPTMPAESREFFRISPQHPAKIEGRLLDLVEYYGFTAHPLDWLPQPDSDLPGGHPSYLPWFHWVETGGRTPWECPELTEETWYSIWPPLRHQLLREMRAAEPARARGLILKHLKEDDEDQIVKLVSILSVNLTDDDQSDLEKIRYARATVRPGIRWEAANLLSRLGVSTSTQSLSKPLREAFPVARRHGQLTITGFPHQVFRYGSGWGSEMATQADLSNVLGVSMEKLARMWDLDHYPQYLFDWIAESGSQAMVDVLFDRIVAKILREWRRGPDVSKQGRDLMFNLTQPFLARASTEVLQRMVRTLSRHPHDVNYISDLMFKMRPEFSQWSESCLTSVNMYFVETYVTYEDSFAFIASPQIAAKLLERFPSIYTPGENLAPLSLVVALSEASRSLPSQEPT